MNFVCHTHVASVWAPRPLALPLSIWYSVGGDAVTVNASGAYDQGMCPQPCVQGLCITIYKVVECHVGWVGECEWARIAQSWFIHNLHLMVPAHCVLRCVSHCPLLAAATSMPVAATMKR